MSSLITGSEEEGFSVAMECPTCGRCIKLSFKPKEIEVAKSSGEAIVKESYCTDPPGHLSGQDAVTIQASFDPHRPPRRRILVVPMP